MQHDKTYNRLDPEKKRIWVEALRSGNYKQNRNYLKTPNGMCCLGVYADAVERVEWQPNETFDEPFSFCCGTYITGLPKNWIDEKAVRHLIKLNDVTQKDFNAIADWIEENL